MNDQTTGAEPDPTEQTAVVTDDYVEPGESETVLVYRNRRTGREREFVESAKAGSQTVRRPWFGGRL